MEIKVREYHLRPNSPNGHMVSVPREWVEDLGLKGGQILELYRNEKDDLIIRPRRDK